MKLQKFAIALFALSMTGAIAGGGKHQASSDKSSQQTATANQPASSADSSQMSASANQPASSNQSASGSASGAAADEQVRMAQQQLKDKGHDPGAIDGVMGPRTKQALKTFQQAQGLQASGQLDQQTLAALGGSGGAKTASASGSTSSSANQPSSAESTRVASASQPSSSANTSSSANQGSSSASQPSANQSSSANQTKQ